MGSSSRFIARPATQKEIDAVLRENGITNLDETPPGTITFYGLDQLAAALRRSIREAQELEHENPSF